jgi:drug/metabolite transporter (DMT)-like permease
MLLALSAMWGASFMFIKIGVRELAPTTLVCVRLGIGALTLLPLALVRLGGRETVRQLRAAARPLVATGLVNSAIPIVAISWAEKHIDSGLTAVIQASAPLFTALLAPLRFSRSERVTGVRLAGLLVGFGGVALLVGAQPSGDLLAACAIVFAALCYAVAALYAARRLVAVSPIVSSFGALAAASLALVPFAAAQLPGRVPSLGVTAAVLALAIGGTGFSPGRGRRARSSSRTSCRRSRSATAPSSSASRSPRRRSAAWCSCSRESPSAPGLCGSRAAVNRG